MKKTILNLALVLAFFLGGTVVNASLLGDVTDTILVVTKNTSAPITFTIPSKYTNPNGNLALPYQIEVQDNASNQIIFAVNTKDNWLDLSGLAAQQGHYTVTFAIGDYTESLVVKGF